MIYEYNMYTYTECLFKIVYTPWKNPRNATGYNIIFHFTWYSVRIDNIILYTTYRYLKFKN